MIAVDRHLIFKLLDQGEDFEATLRPPVVPAMKMTSNSQAMARRRAGR